MSMFMTVRKVRCSTKVLSLELLPPPFSCSNIVMASDEVDPPWPPLARDLQLWPELVETGSEVHTSRRKSLYASSFQGQQVILKV